MTLLLTAALSIWAFWQPCETDARVNIILALVGMNLVAYSDILTGRIPVSLVFLVLSAGLFLGLLSQTSLVYIFGGVVNLGIGLLIHYGGVLYFKTVRHKTNQPTAFGMGDVYGAAVIGFLIGFPNCVTALILSFCLALFGGLVSSLIAKRALSEASVSLGYYYFLAVAIVLFITRST
jgi:hypothetical protein